MPLRVFVLLAPDFLRDLLHSNRLFHIHEQVGNVIETFGWSGRGGKIRLFGGSEQKSIGPVSPSSFVFSGGGPLPTIYNIYAAEQALPESSAS